MKLAWMQANLYWFGLNEMSQKANTNSLQNFLRKHGTYSHNVRHLKKNVENNVKSKLFLKKNL